MSSFFEHVRAHSCHLGPFRLAHDGGHHVAAEGGTGLQQQLGLGIDVEPGAVGGEPCIEQGGHPGDEGTPHRGSACDEYLGLVLLDEVQEQSSI